MSKDFIDRKDWNYKYIGLYLSKPNCDKRIIYNTWKLIKEVKLENDDYNNIEELLRFFLIGNGEIEKNGEYIGWVKNDLGILIPKFANYELGFIKNLSENSIKVN